MRSDCRPLNDAALTVIELKMIYVDSRNSAKDEFFTRRITTHAEHVPFRHLQLELNVHCTKSISDSLTCYYFSISIRRYSLSFFFLLTFNFSALFLVLLLFFCLQIIICGYPAGFVLPEVNKHSSVYSIGISITTTTTKKKKSK